MIPSPSDGHDNHKKTNDHGTHKNNKHKGMHKDKGGKYKGSDQGKAATAAATSAATTTSITPTLTHSTSAVVATRLPSLLALVGVVEQSAGLFSGTIAENIGYGSSTGQSYADPTPTLRFFNLVLVLVLVLVLWRRTSHMGSPR